MPCPLEPFALASASPWPLARMAMYKRGVDVLLAPTWDTSEEWVPTLRHIAKKGQVFVVGVTAILRGSDEPRDLPNADERTAATTTSCRAATPPSSPRAGRSSSGH